MNNTCPIPGFCVASAVKLKNVNEAANAIATRNGFEKKKIVFFEKLFELTLVPRFWFNKVSKTWITIRTISISIAMNNQKKNFSSPGSETNNCLAKPVSTTQIPVAVWNKKNKLAKKYSFERRPILFIKITNWEGNKKKFGVSFL